MKYELVKEQIEEIKKEYAEKLNNAIEELIKTSSEESDDWKEYHGYIVFRDGTIENKFGRKLRLSEPKGKNCHRQYIKTTLNINGTMKTVAIHRLLAELFIPNPHNYSDVNHKDGNKWNNNVDNLEWCSHSANMEHAKNNQLGIKHRYDLYKDDELIATDLSYREINEYVLFKNANNVNSIDRKGNYHWVLCD